MKRLSVRPEVGANSGPSFIPAYPTCGEEMGSRQSVSNLPKRDLRIQVKQRWRPPHLGNSYGTACLTRWFVQFICGRARPSRRRLLRQQCMQVRLVSDRGLQRGLRENDVVVRPEPPELRLPLAAICRL
jgi:hypothetical protein